VRCYVAHAAIALSLIGINLNGVKAETLTAVLEQFCREQPSSGIPQNFPCTSVILKLDCDLAFNFEEHSLYESMDRYLDHFIETNEREISIRVDAGFQLNGLLPQLNDLLPRLNPYLPHVAFPADPVRELDCCVLAEERRPHLAMTGCCLANR
jgi:hypothetical protein